MNKLNEEIKKTERSEGYLVMITRLNNHQLTHTYFTQNFPRGDINLSIDEWKKLLKKEIMDQNNIREAETLKNKEKKLPPRYRKNGYNKQK